MLSDVNDYPVDRDVYDCIRCVGAKPFDVNFDVQVEAAEELYGSQLKFSFGRRDIPLILDPLRDLYPDATIHRVERTIYEQMRKYPVYFLRVPSNPVIYAWV